MGQGFHEEIVLRLQRVIVGALLGCLQERASHPAIAALGLVILSACDEREDLIPGTRAESGIANHAAILGLVLGLDREWRGHAAGMRTHGLICVSAAAMVVSIMALYHQLDGPRMDPLRLFEAAGAFIGIIGAGLIVFSKGQLHNLTTAAHLWLATMVGIACGAAQWPLVAILTVVSLVMITVLRIAENKFGKEDRNIARSIGRSPDE
jgi:putative Mg2+ transporter-C (MgtC) family protein